MNSKALLIALLATSIALIGCGGDNAANRSGAEADAANTEDRDAGAETDVRSDAGSAADASNEDDGGDVDAGTDAGVEEVPFQSGVEVETSNGTARGEEDGDLRVFKGIPYAEPPTGDRRLAAPVPVGPWTGVLDATEFGDSCPQSAITINQRSEDCLNLNVWAHRDDTERPVMVWIYGGGFIAGETAVSAYDGEDLAEDADVIVITINYRLGPLANLAIPELQQEDSMGAVGNMGLLDQIEALRWIKRNAPAFGGDPDNITVFGESAGAISACALIGAPLADDLFHKAIIQSGNCELFTRLDGEGGFGKGAFEFGEEVVAELGCADAADRLACLRALPYEDFEDVIDLTSLLNLLGTNASLGPTIDGVVLPQTPYARIVAGEAPERPIVAGSNGNEAQIFTFATAIFTRSDFEDTIEGLIGDPSVAEAVVDLYSFVEFPVARDAFNAFVGELLFNCNTYHAVRSLPGNGFYYNLAIGPTVMMTPYGPLHGADIFYVFGNFTTSGIIPSFFDLDLSSQMQQSWGDFARTGVPSWEDETWPAATETAPRHMEIDVFPGPDDGFRGGRCDELQALGVLP